MAPNSAYANAPKKVSSPPNNHAARMSPADGKLRAIALGTMKIADPITVPITMTVASSNPSLRGSSALGMSGKPIAWSERGASWGGTPAILSEEPALLIDLGEHRRSDLRSVAELFAVALASDD